MTLDLLFKSILRDVVREVVRDEMQPSAPRVADAEFLSYKQAAELVGVSTKTIKTWVYSGRLTSYGDTPRIKRVKSEDVRACMLRVRRRAPDTESVEDRVAQMLAKGVR